jgi:hypothetical protein
MGFLLIAAAGAKERGRNTHCRNNLRKLGEMAYQKAASEDQRTAEGRAYWQEVRQEYFTDVKGGKETWIVRFGGLNPFGCPVKGVQPLNLAKLSEADLTRLMTDPTTIDYRGPRLQGASPLPRPEALGADIEGNHGGSGGNILLIDLSVREIRDAVRVAPISENTAAASTLTP